MSNVWIRDKVFKDVGMSIKVNETLLDSRTKFQKIEVHDTTRFGKVLVLDGAIQTTEKDEFTYHEMMAHVPINAHGNVKSVLIIGGGDGGALEEVLKHKSVERVVMVEIDEEVIRVSKQFLPSISKNAFEDPRANIVIQDAVQWVKGAIEKFDVILVDRTDSVDDTDGISGDLYTSKFYKDCKNILNPQGILVAQAGMITFSGGSITTDLCNAAQVWTKTSLFITAVPSYSGGFQAMLWASDWNITSVSDQDLVARQNLPDLKYYDARIHRASFALPKFAQAL
jgi:spermidine synthase